jgi:hypothetical protein
MRIDPLLTGVGSWSPGESGDARTAEHSVHQDICRTRELEHGTTSRCGVQVSAETATRPGSPQPLLRAFPRPAVPPLAAFQCTSTPPNAESARTHGATPRFKTERRVRSCARCLGEHGGFASGTHWPTGRVAQASGEGRRFISSMDEGVELRAPRRRVAAGGA